MYDEEQQQNVLTAPLLNDGQNAELDTASLKEIAIKSAVSLAFLTPFCFTAKKVTDEYSVAGAIPSVIACGCIAYIAWVLYAEHFIGLCNIVRRPGAADELSHIAGHLGIDDEDAIPRWSTLKKSLITAAVVLFTLILGFTKISTVSGNGVELFALLVLWLAIYSLIDAGPHVNHLQLQSQAWGKFLILPWYSKLWVLTLMLGHALNDSADLWNTSGYLFAWVCVAITVEAYLCNVEAVAHYQPHIPELTWANAAKFLVIFLGAVGMAFFNWYNTYQDPSRFELEKPSPLLFCSAQFVNVLFLTFEAWNHADEPADEVVDGNGVHGEVEQGDFYSSQVDGEMRNFIPNNFGQMFFVGRGNRDVARDDFATNAASGSQQPSSDAIPGAGWAKNHRGGCRAGCKH